MPTTEEVSIYPEEKQNDKIMIDFISIEKSWFRNEIIIDHIFSFTVGLNIKNDDENHDPKTVEEFDIEMIGQNEKILFNQS